MRGLWGQPGEDGEHPLVLDPAVWIDAMGNHTPFVMMLTTMAFGVGALLGGLILGIVMVRQRGTVPAWAGWALIASVPVRMAGLMLGIPVGPPLAPLLIMAGFAGALLAARTADERPFVKLRDR